MKSLFKIFTILPRDQYKMCAFIIFAMIIGAILEAIGIGAILPLISIMGNDHFLNEHIDLAEFVGKIGIGNHVDFIVFLSVLLIIIYFLKNLFIAWELNLQISFSVKNQVYYSKELLAEYLSKPYLFHVNNNTATLIRNVSNGATVAFSYILIPTLMLLTELVTAVTIWAMLIFIDPFTAVVVAGILCIIIVCVLKFFRRKITAQGVIQNNYAAHYLKWLNQSLGAVKETQIMHREEFFTQEFNNAYKRYGEANGKFTFLNQLPRMIVEACGVGGILILIIVKLMLGSNPENIVPLLGVLAMASFRLMPSANRIINLTNGIKFQMPLFEELYSEFKSIREHRNARIIRKVNEHILSFNDKICINHVSFRYPEGQENVLNDISFTIHKGSFVGIIGPSGAGKTTFVDILLGLLGPTSGKITVDGVDIASDIRAWQENLAYVPQSIYLIDGTIKENIALGTKLKDIDDAEIEKALKMAELYDFIMALPDGLDTQVGERGVKLSGGQMQRIGIARALYQQPKVLILDEATSALDNDTEKSITDTILKLKGTITILSIAHRVSTLEECDYKVEFKDGNVSIIDNRIIM